MDRDKIVRSIEEAVREEYGCEVEVGRGTRATREDDDGNIVVQAQSGRMVTESHIQADFHQECWETDRDFDVTVTPDGVVLEIEEVG